MVLVWSWKLPSRIKGSHIALCGYVLVKLQFSVIWFWCNLSFGNDPFSIYILWYDYIIICNYDIFPILIHVNHIWSIIIYYQYIHFVSEREHDVFPPSNSTRLLKQHVWCIMPWFWCWMQIHFFCDPNHPKFPVTSSIWPVDLWISQQFIECHECVD